MARGCLNRVSCPLNPRWNGCRSGAGCVAQTRTFLDPQIYWLGAATGDIFNLTTSLLFAGPTAVFSPGSIACPTTSTIPPYAAPVRPSSFHDAGPTSTSSSSARHHPATSHRNWGGSTTTEQHNGQQQYELADLRDLQTRRDRDDREARRATKREEKRRWLDEQDEMKFSHSIQFNAVPDWSSHYIAYSNLKKLYVALRFPKPQWPHRV
jgi:hypothetical protein